MGMLRDIFPEVGYVSDFLRERQQFANERARGLFNRESLPWNWNALPTPDMNAELTPEMETRAKEGMAQAVGDAFGAGIAKGTKVYRGVREGTAELGFRKPREFGAHWSTDPKVAYDFAKSNELDEAFDATKKATILKGKVLVGNAYKMPDLGHFSVRNVLQELAADPKGQLGVDDAYDFSAMARSYDDAVKDLQRASYDGKLPADVSYADALQDINEVFTTRAQRKLKELGFDHIEYINTNEYGVLRGRAKPAAPSVILFDEGDVAVSAADYPKDLKVPTTRMSDPTGPRGQSLLRNIVSEPDKYGMYIRPDEIDKLGAVSAKMSANTRIANELYERGDISYAAYKARLDANDKWAHNIIAQIAKRSRYMHGKATRGITVKEGIPDDIEEILIRDVGEK